MTRRFRIGPIDPIFDGTPPPGAISPGNTPPTTLVGVTINQGSGQPDPTYNADIVFDIVFTEPVTGFSTGDVTLGGTANPTTQIVSGTGSVYTVTVSGMANDGTVIATIAAGVCVSISAGTPNNASTSTDNVVTWEFTGLFYQDLIDQNPVGMFPLRELSGTILHDTSATGNDGTYRAGNTLGAVAGPDGFSYADMAAGAGIGTNGGEVPYLADYSITLAGLTVVYVVWDVDGTNHVAKTAWTTPGTTEWNVSAAGGIDGLVADAYGSPLRSFFFGAPLVSGQWNVIIIRFPDQTTHPNLSANGVVPLAYSTTLGGTVTPNIQPLQIGGLNSGAGAGGPMGLVAIYDTFQSDAWCDARMAVANGEGWF